MSDGIDELRADLARERSLPNGAEKFLTAATADELERQADGLAQMLGTTTEQRSEPARDLFTVAADAKATRKQVIIGMFTGAVGQPRDQAGRFTAGGFDGGARATAMPQRDATADHGRLLGGLLGKTVARRGVHF